MPSEVQSNSLDPDQVWSFIGPDLCPNCLQKVTNRQQNAGIYILYSSNKLKDQYYQL